MLIYSCVLNHFIGVQLLVIPWTIARQAPLSMGFSRQEYWSGLPFPSPGDLPNPGIEPPSLMSPVLTGMFFTTSTTCKAPDLFMLCMCLVTQSCPATCDPMDCNPPGSSVHGGSPGKNTEVGCRFFLQGVFPTQASNPGLPRYRQILYCLRHQGNPSTYKTNNKFLNGFIYVS